MKATGKRAIVTGSSRGLGYEIAKALLQEGISVAVVARKQGDLDTTLKSLSSHTNSSEVIGFLADLSLEKDIEVYSEKVKKTWPDVDIIVNNVGIYVEDSAGQNISANLQKQLEVNLLATVRITGQFLDLMKKGRKGQIINIVSIAARDLRADAASYSISKYALKAYTDLLRRSLREHGIRVLGIYPGPMNTSSWDATSKDTSKMVQTSDVTKAILNALHQSSNSTVEDIVINTLSTY